MGTLQRKLLRMTVIVLILATGCGFGEKESHTEPEEATDPDTNSTTEDTNPVQDSGGTDSGGTEEVEIGEYCAFNDPELANCDPNRTYDPWIAGTGEVHYWIRDKQTEVFHSPQMIIQIFGTVIFI